MKNKLAQIKSLRKALKNYTPPKKNKEVKEDLPANAVGQGGVDMNPTGRKLNIKKRPLTRFEPAFDKRYKSKNLLLTKFRNFVSM